MNQGLEVNYQIVISKTVSINNFAKLGILIMSEIFHHFVLFEFEVDSCLFLKLVAKWRRSRVRSVAAIFCFGYFSSFFLGGYFYSFVFFI